MLAEPIHRFIQTVIIKLFIVSYILKLFILDPIKDVPEISKDPILSQYEKQIKWLTNILCS